MAHGGFLRVDQAESNTRMQPVVEPNAGSQSRIVVAGAGSIGCYTGGCLALAGRNVTLLLRERLAVPISRYGLRVRDLGGVECLVPQELLTLETNPKKALLKADIVLVTVKAGATPEMADLIARYVPDGAAIVSLQNGIGNDRTLSTRLGNGFKVIPGMVPFNVVQKHDKEGVCVQRATSGTILIGDTLPGLADQLNVEAYPVAAHPNMSGVMWSKLVLNMNNALNALSGLPLVEELSDPLWRNLLAAQMDEALTAIRSANIGLARIEGVNPKLIPFALRLPTPLFKLVARRMLDIDPAARSSMWEDFEQGRATEIDHLQGAVIDLAREFGLSAPISERVVALVKEREKDGRQSTRVSPDEIAGDAEQ